MTIVEITIGVLVLALATWAIRERMSPRKGSGNPPSTGASFDRDARANSDSDALDLFERHERQYRELQHIWHSALGHGEAKRYGMAIRILEEGIRLAESPEYDDADRLFKMRRDLADFLAFSGQVERAVPLMREIGRLYRAGKTFQKAGRLEEAVSAYRECMETGQTHVHSDMIDALFALGQEQECLDELEILAAASQTNGSDGFSPGRCTMAIRGMEARHGREVLEDDTQWLRARYPAVVQGIERQYGNWTSAIGIVSGAWSKQSASSIVKRVSSPRKSTPPDMAVDELEVMSVLRRASGHADEARVLDRARDLAQSGRFPDARALIDRLREGASAVDEFILREALRELLLAEGRLTDALSWEPEGFVQAGTRGLELKLNLLYYTGAKLTGDLVARHFIGRAGHETKFLRAHIDEFAALCQERLDTYEGRHGVDLLQKLANTCEKSKNGGWSGAFCQNGVYSNGSRLPYLCFFEKEGTWSAFERVVKDGEGGVRDSLGLPGIGEGWVSEALVVVYLRKLLSPHDVVRQGSPPWLGAQRFDAWIPSLGLAVEYQGEQHYRPVQRFGGEEGFRGSQERDRRKLALAIANGTIVEYVRFDEDVDRRVVEIARKYLHGTRGCLG